MLFRSNYPASGADTAGGNSGCSWGSPANVGSGASTTSCNVAANATGNASSHFLYASNFGFAIPSDATITGITLEIRRNAAATSALVDNVVRLAKTNNQTNLGTSFANATTWPSTLTTQTYGDAAALWGTTWTPAEVNASTFGAVLSVSNATGTARSATVDWFRITVAYTFSTAPTVTLVQSATQADPTNIAPVVFTLTSGGTRTLYGPSVNASDFTVTNGTIGTIEMRLSSALVW